jgi:uncharacterized protein (DUF58 family)
MKKLWLVFKSFWKFIVLPLLIISTFSYAMFQGGFVSWFLFYSFMPFALYSAAISFYPLNEIEVERHLKKVDYTAGETLNVMITIRRKFPFPLFYLVIEDQMGDTMKYLPKQSMLLFPGFKKEFSSEYTINELPRGEHFFQGFKLRIGDPIGLIEKEKIVDNEEKIIVYPSYFEILYRLVENHYDQGMTASRERVQRDTSMAIGVREYQPGDRFSWINWKATAKRNDIMTKEFEQRQSHDVFVVMDCAPDPHFESIVSFTASLLRAVLKKGAQIGLLSISQERVSFPIRGGEQQLQRLFYHLAKVQPKSSASFNKILEADQFSEQTVSFMLVTAQLTKELIERASFLGQRKGAVTIFLIKGERESSKQAELTLKAMATGRGVRVVLVHEGHYAAAFSEVNLR